MSLQRRISDIDPLRLSIIAVFILAVILAIGSLLFPDIFWDGFLWKYFAGPLYSDARGETVDDISEGYNPVNTLGYGLILSLSVYWIHTFLDKKNVEIDRRFALAIIPYVLLGSTLRVLEDADYFSEPVNYLMISPLIYIVVGLFTLLMVYLSILFQDLSANVTRPWKPSNAESFLNLTWLITFACYSTLFIGVGDSFIHIEHPILILSVLGATLLITKKIWYRAILDHLLEPALIQVPKKSEMKNGDGATNENMDGTTETENKTVEKGLNDGTTETEENTVEQEMKEETAEAEEKTIGTGQKEGTTGVESTERPVPVMYHIYLGSIGWFCFIISLYHLGWWGWKESDELLMHVIPGIMIMTIIAWAITLKFLRFMNERKHIGIPTSIWGMNSLMIFSQFLDGAATYTGLDFYGYREKHVLPAFLIDLAGTAAVMFVLKFLVLMLAIYLLDIEYKEEMAEHPKLFGLIKIVVIILGLAPGTRDMLRLAFGT